MENHLLMTPGGWQNWMQKLETNGFAMLHGLVSSEESERLLAAIDREQLAAHSSCRGGVRNLLSLLPEAKDLAAGAALRDLASAVLGVRSFVVRGILFDKSPAANWKVVWHQDLTIAVRERRDVDG